MRFVKAALATFALVYAASFWPRTDRLRERLGVYFVLDGDGYPTDRLDGGGLGAWLNCPMCAAVMLFPLGWLLKDVLSGLGLGLLLIRWYESLRPKAEWWL